MILMFEESAVSFWNKRRRWYTRECEGKNANWKVTQASKMRAV